MHCFETTGVIDETVTQEVYAHMLSKRAPIRSDWLYCCSCCFGDCLCDVVI